MSANVTTVAPTHTPSSNGLKGTAPAVFTGDRSRSESFWNEFRRYRLLNRNNESISIPFFRMLTALSYIKGPLVEDWVNTQDEELEQCTDSTKPGSVREKTKILWNKFEASFKAAWTDTTKVQSAYSQLMKLQMKDLDIDTYNATFARLANAAGWEADAKGTIDRYRSGSSGKPSNAESSTATTCPTPWTSGKQRLERKSPSQRATEFRTYRTPPKPKSRDNTHTRNTGQRSHSNATTVNTYPWT
jgi:hypothetical protein